MSSTTRARCPTRTCVSSVSLKLASTQGRCAATSANNGVDALTCSPGCVRTLTTMPSIGARICVRARSSAARSRAALLLAHHRVLIGRQLRIAVERRQHPLQLLLHHADAIGGAARVVLRLVAFAGREHAGPRQLFLALPLALGIGGARFGVGQLTDRLAPGGAQGLDMGARGVELGLCRCRAPAGTGAGLDRQQHVAGP